jgi:hypothetical protein
MHDVLFENQEALDGEDLVGYASALGLGIAILPGRACLKKRVEIRV